MVKPKARKGPETVRFDKSVLRTIYTHAGAEALAAYVMETIAPPAELKGEGPAVPIDLSSSNSAPPKTEVRKLAPAP